MELNKPLSVSGKVKPFKGNGRKFGYPTANLVEEVALNDGVYFGYASLKDYKDHPAIIFIGVPTTVGDTERRVEAHLLDIADRDYYNENLDLTILWFHRGNRKFDSLDLLLEAMREDELTARTWFKNNPLLS
jgi:riboflavin kinase/FMN adenylyltransferase